MVQLEGDRRERQQPDDPHAAPTEPDEVADQQRQPDPQEGRPLERPERTEQPRDRRRVVERAEPADADLVRVGRVHVPVREGVEADRPAVRRDDDEQVAEEEQPGDDRPSRMARRIGRLAIVVVTRASWWGDRVGSDARPSMAGSVAASSGGRTPPAWSTAGTSAVCGLTRTEALTASAQPALVGA